MYEEFFGLKEKPFSIQPDPSFLYWGRGHRLAYAMLEYGVVNQAGISVITGEVGCGKTTLIHWLLNQLSDTHTIALLSNIQAGRGDLLSWVLMGYGEPFNGKSHVEMFAQLQAFFIREYSKGKRVVLIIDEAQNLSVDMLEELRMLSNINAGKDQLLQLILVGQPQLKDLLSRPDMLQLAQRIGSDFHLTPLTREETHAYIETRLVIAGARDDIFTSAAMDMVAEHSRGVPRVINTIADTALVYAFSAQEPRVTPETVQNVIRDKLDYGVFGLANSPDLKLAEGTPARTASGFLPSEPAARPRAVSLNVSQTYKAPATPEPVAAGASLYDFHTPASTNVAANVAATARAAETRPVEARAIEPHVVEPRPVESRPVEPRAVEMPRVAEPARADALTATRAAPQPRNEKSPAVNEIGLIIIGADERLADTLASAPEDIATVIVAFSGSPEAVAAGELGLDVVEVDGGAFSGGRARNAGYRRLKKIAPDLKFVQFVRSGSAFQPDWFAAAARFMARRPEVAVLEGQTTLRSKSGKISVSRVSDGEASGEIQAAGYDALFRADAFEAAGGFRGDIIADETADLCIRLRRRGAHIWRSEDAMAIAPKSGDGVKSWRAQAVDDGYAYAAGAALHGGPPEKFRAREQSRAVVWGAAFPAAILLAALTAGVSVGAASGPERGAGFAMVILAVGFGVYFLKVAFLAAPYGVLKPASWLYGVETVMRHFYEFRGVANYWFSTRKRAPRKAVA